MGCALIMLMGGCASPATNDAESGGGDGGSVGGAGGSDGGTGGAVTTDTGGMGGMGGMGDQGCSAPLIECAGECINPLDSQEHCGVCDNTCLGQPCDQGECRGTLLANQLTNPLDLVHDGTDAFISNLGLIGLGGVDRVPLATGTAEVLMAGTNWGGWAIGIDDGHVYMSDNGVGVTSIYAIPKTAVNVAPPTPIATMNLSNTMRGLVVVDSHVYWVEQSGAGVRRAPKTGGAVETLIDAQSGYTGGRMIDDVDHIYWTWSTATGGQVMQLDKAGASAPKVVADEQPHPWALHLDGTTLYWTNIGTPQDGAADAFGSAPYSGSISRIDLTQSQATIETLVSSQHHPMSLLVHDGYLYWGSNESDSQLPGWDPMVHTAQAGTVWRQPLAGGEPDALGVEYQLIPSMRLDGDTLLFLSAANGGFGGGSFYRWELK